MVLGVDGHLHVLAHNTRASASCGHRTSIEIGKRYLLVWRGQHLHIDCLEPLHFLFCKGVWDGVALWEQRFRRAGRAMDIRSDATSRRALGGVKHYPNS